MLQNTEREILIINTKNRDCNKAFGGGNKIKKTTDFI